MEISLEQNSGEFSQEEPRRSFAQALLDALPSAALVADARGRIAALNQHAELFLGWNAATLQWQPIHEILDCRVDDTGETAEDCPVLSLLHGGPVKPQGRMWVRCRGESLRPIQFHCTPFPSAAGLGVILTFQDMTRQLELEKDLRRLASIAEQSPIAIVELNQDGNMTYANPAMLELVQRFGFTSEARPAVLPANMSELAAECFTNNREIAAVEVRVGNTYFEWKLSPVPHANLMRGYGIDLTARKRAELELAAAKDKAEAASRAKSEFLANTSHEIRSPIHVILGMADLLAQTSLNEEQHQYVTAIRSNGEGLSTVVGDILEMASLDAEIVKIELGCLDLHAYIEKHISGWAKRAQEKGLRLNLSISKNVPVNVQCDCKKIDQLLDKLLSNAIKFTEHGQIAVEVERGPILPPGSTCDPCSEEKRFQLFVTVVDSGIGVSPEMQQRIFDRFSQADSSTRRCYEGTGLGLAIAKKLTELMGGHIGVESASGQGSKFWFSVPAIEIAPPGA